MALPFLFGCATPQTDSLMQQRGALPAEVELANVAFYPQAENECGPASLAMALTASGITITPDALTPTVFTPGRNGSLQTDMLSASRRHGRLAYPIRDMRSMLTEIAAGTPVVVFQNLALSWYPQWHYAVAIGYDMSDRAIILHSGETARLRLPLTTFEHTWERGGHWAIAIMPPDRLPATAEPRRYTDAVKGLEQARQFEAAARAYATALDRWPDDLQAQMGLGNAFYALGRKSDSAEAFRQATIRHPDAAAAFNNLAHVLADLEQWPEAEQMARRAVTIGGPFADTARKTLDEIRLRRKDMSAAWTPPAARPEQTASLMP